jgi:hypothetical protein
VNRQGQVIDRVILPESTALVGLGAGGTVYLMRADGAHGQLIRTSWR